MESVILNSPLLVVLYGIALAICLLDLKLKTTGYIFPLVSCFIVVCTSVYALIIGASILEIVTILLIFLLINLCELGRNK